MFLEPLNRWCLSYLASTGLLLRCSDAPDTTKQGEAAIATAKLSKEQLDWAKQIYSDTAPDRAAAAKRANDVSDLQMDATRKGMALADNYDQYNQSTFRPLERGIVSDAQNYDTEANRSQLAGKALGDVNESFANAREQGVRDLTRRGVNPNDGNYGGVAGRLALSQSLAGADAATKSRQQATTLGRALKLDAANLGRNLPSQQSTAAGLALNAGNSSVNSANAALAPAQQSQVTLGNAYNGARSGYAQSGNIYGNIANEQAGVDNSNSQTAGSAGAAIGTIAVLI